MVWVRLDDDFPDHPKIVSLGDLTPLAGWLHICGLCYCNRYLTDGVIPRTKVKTLASFEHIGIETAAVGGSCGIGHDIEVGELVDALIEAGMWEERESDYRIHDYLDYQPSKAQVEALQEVRSEAGKRGAASRWRSGVDGKSHGKTMAKLCPVPVPVPVIDNLKKEDIVAESPVDNLVELALTELPESQSAPVDYFRTIDRYRSKLSDEHIERIIVDLANWRPKNPIDWKEKKAHLTLAKWLNKEPRDPLPPSHVPAKLPEYDGTEIPMPAEIKLMIENVGRKM